MNPAMIQRAIARHRHMQDLPAYREFLEHVRDYGDTWLVPQAEVTAWWEQRQHARLVILAEAGSLSLHCDLEGACVEIDGDQVEPLPHRRVEPGLAEDPVEAPAYDAKLSSPFFEEILGHLGYRHLQPAPSYAPEGPLVAARLRPLLEAAHESAARHQRFSEQELGAIRDAMRAEHHRVGLPDLRLWTLPHAGGRPYRAAVSSRYDVDKAIVNLPLIHDLEESFGLRSTVYLRPLGMFYGRREILRYLPRSEGHEIALHGEFLSTAGRFGSERAAAVGEKRLLEEMVQREVQGVCMHGGELRSNTSPTTRDSVEAAGYRYETMFRNGYYLPLHLPVEEGVRRTLSIGQHFADISVPSTEGFAEKLCARFVEHYEAARAVGGVFVPVMHPLYFDLGNYLRYPSNFVRIAAFVPRFLWNAARMKRGQSYVNDPRA